MNIVFLGGISGCGKSTAGKYLEEHLHWKHLEIDLSPVDGLVHHNLIAEAKKFETTADATQLVGVLKNRYPDYAGIILTFPSVVVFPAPHVINNPKIKFRYLFGSPEHAVARFIEREKATGRNLTTAHWEKNNVWVYKALEPVFNRPLLVNTLAADGSWRDRTAILEAITG
jgi:hypothetical protein